MVSGISLERVNIVVVDDNRHMRGLLKNLLNALGCRHVAEAADGADAFKELRNFPADLIITDWEMSPLDGIDFVRLVRTAKDSPSPYVPIIMLTGHTEMHRICEARDAGVTEFLAKPISAKSLYGRICTIITKPRAFVRTSKYFGPDRRRRQTEFKGPERRHDGAAKVDRGSSSKALTKEEIDALLRES